RAIAGLVDRPGAGAERTIGAHADDDACGFALASRSFSQIKKHELVFPSQWFQWPGYSPGNHSSAALYWNLPRRFPAGNVRRWIAAKLRGLSQTLFDGLEITGLDF